MSAAAPVSSVSDLPRVEVVHAAEGWPDDADAVVQRAARAVLSGFADAASFGDISVALMDDASIQVLNRDYRGKDAPTNVLSFPVEEDGGILPPGERLPLGDIAVALETVVREAVEEEKTLAAHLTHMVVHGTLHLLGYDHELDSEAEEMETMERDVLASLGIADPYRT
ncbi:MULTISPECIES: rRNA maturation RNase YbeY [unclassified Minwuia]|uniref:rRNA maturation RNase YbeY n=1 Tax=unclassified Minwuia TaxID=2618799 RepID=UPI00247ABCC3|nr:MULTISPECIES: rRNA maturation RNase YbeY [unclassified Minwuia]